MAVSYKKFWKHLIDKDMKRKDLCAKAGINLASVAKMGAERPYYHKDSPKSSVRRWITG